MARETFSILRRALRGLGLNSAASDDVVGLVSEKIGIDDKANYNQRPYHLREDFLSPAERSFFLVLRQSVHDWAMVCPKVSLGDLFFAKTGNHSRNVGYTNKINRKHVDFLLLDAKRATPILGVELDDSSHQRKDRQERDQFVAQVFRAARLPLARVKARRNYQTRELGASLRRAAGFSDDLSRISSTQTAPRPQRQTRQHTRSAPPKQPSLANTDKASAHTDLTVSTPELGLPIVPLCPLCGARMARQTRSTPSEGQNIIWVCTDPGCAGSRIYSSADPSSLHSLF